MGTIEPWYSAPDAAFYHGDVLAVLKELPTGSVQIAATSPPYYGLRAYAGVPPTVWGGDDHTHSWTGLVIPGHPVLGATSKLSTRDSKRQSFGAVLEETCECGAVRSFLGRESLPYCDGALVGAAVCQRCYVCHLRVIFREVKRVLRADGTFWLNVADASAGSGQDWSGQDQNAPRRWGGKEAPEGSRGARIGSSDGESGHSSGVTPPAGWKAKDIYLIPEALALALHRDGWFVRSRIAWCKLAGMPESVTDRPTNAWEHIWLLSKKDRYFYDPWAVRQSSTSVEQEAHNQRYARVYGTDLARSENGQPGAVNSPGIHSRPGPGGANLRNWWPLPPSPTDNAHYAPYPLEIPRRAILAGSSAKGQCSKCGKPWTRIVERTAMVIRRSDWGKGAGTRTAASGTMEEPPTARTVGWKAGCQCGAEVEPQTICDPFLGSGTSAVVARQLGRRIIGIDASEPYLEIARKRLEGQTPMLPLDEENGVISPEQLSFLQEERQ